MFFNKDYKEIKQCLCCGSDLVKVIDLGKHSLPNYYPKSTKEKLKKYPLVLNRCMNCFHCQLSIAINPEIMFSNYSYVSGTSNTLLNYFEEFYQYVCKRNPGKLKVLDIASNDGSLLVPFKMNDHDVLGIDPAANLAEIALKKHGIITASDFFNYEKAKYCFTKYENKFDVVIAQNVLGHVSDPKDFIKGIWYALRPEGRAYIQTSQCNMISNKEFDTIYFEHISYFNTHSFCSLIKDYFYISDFQIKNIHGDSYLFELTRINDKKHIQNSFEFNYRFNYEYDVQERFEEKTYKNFEKSAFVTKKALKLVLEEKKKQGYDIIGYGAAAKGNTVLNYCEINNKLIDYIIDDSELKTNRFTPLSNIPIINPNTKVITNKTIVVIFAWNFLDEIKLKLKKWNESNNNCEIKFLTFFPNIKLEGFESNKDIMIGANCKNE